MIVWARADAPVTSPEQELYETGEAWRKWRVHSCAEWNGGHEWLLELIVGPGGDDLDRGIELCCRHCPAGIDDVYPDGHDLMGGQFGEVTVQDGTHNSPVPLLIPVDVEPWARRYYNPYCGEEWDAGVELHQRGPAVPVRFDIQPPIPADDH